MPRRMPMPSPNFNNVQDILFQPSRLAWCELARANDLGGIPRNRREGRMGLAAVCPLRYCGLYGDCRLLDMGVGVAASARNPIPLEVFSRRRPGELDPL